jgi:hypothetical protein
MLLQKNGGSVYGDLKNRNLPYVVRMMVISHPMTNVFEFYVLLLFMQNFYFVSTNYYRYTLVLRQWWKFAPRPSGAAGSGARR